MNIKMSVEGKTVTIWALTLKEKEKCGQPWSGTQMSSHACTPRGAYSLKLVFNFSLFYLHSIFKRKHLSLENFFFHQEIKRKHFFLRFINWMCC